GATSLMDQIALDPYTFLRDAYLARRRNQVYDGDPPPLPEEPAPGSSEPAR
ncbi:MAG: VacJ family lipoprotein, partial [Rubrivivax sp.]|nr:VacJ family lipoprotein [Rubrivivax sp.]